MGEFCHQFVKLRGQLIHFREVFKARDCSNPKKFVAMKKVLMDNEKEGVRTCLFLFRVSVSTVVLIVSHNSTARDKNTPVIKT